MQCDWAVGRYMIQFWEVKKVKMLVAQSCSTLCNPMNCSPVGSSVHGISQARKLERVVISFSRGSSPPGDLTCVSCIGRWILYHLVTWEAQRRVCVCLVAQLCLTLCNPMDCSPSGSSVRGILQTRILDWITMPSYRASSQSRD